MLFRPTPQGGIHTDSHGFTRPHFIENSRFLLEIIGFCIRNRQKRVPKQRPAATGLQERPGGLLGSIFGACLGPFGVPDLQFEIGAKFHSGAIGMGPGVQNPLSKCTQIYNSRSGWVRLGRESIRGNPGGSGKPLEASGKPLIFLSRFLK